MFKVSLFIVVVATTTALALPQKNLKNLLPDGRIIGGQDADIADYPYQLALYITGGYQCGAVLFDKKWVLTAAHCTEGVYDPSDIHIGAGNSKLFEGDEFVVANIYQNSNFSYYTLDYDISVLELEEEIDIENAVPIELVDDDYVAPEGATATVTGWGSTKEGGPNTKQLQVVEVPVVSAQVCDSIYRGIFTDRMVCAGDIANGGKDACGGDSGGPMVVDGKLVGVVSFGAGCAQPGYPGVYTSIANLRGFIRDKSGL